MARIAHAKIAKTVAKLASHDIDKWFRVGYRSSEGMILCVTVL